MFSSAEQTLLRPNVFFCLCVLGSVNSLSPG